MSLRPLHIAPLFMVALLIGVFIGRMTVDHPSTSASKSPPISSPPTEGLKLIAVADAPLKPVSTHEGPTAVVQPPQPDTRNIKTAIKWMNTQYVQLLKDPQIYTALKLSNARQLESEYGAYIRAMHLSSAAKRKFLDIMADGLLSRIEVSALEDVAGLSSQSSLNKEVDKEERSQLTALLGADGLQKLDFFSENQRAWKSTDAFAIKLDEANVPLNANQHLAIIAKLAEGKLKLTSDGSKEKLAPLLTPDQLQQLDRYLAEEMLINQAKEIHDQLRKRSLQLMKAQPGN